MTKSWLWNRIRSSSKIKQRTDGEIPVKEKTSVRENCIVIKESLPCKLALWRLAAANKAPRRFAPVNSHLSRQNTIIKTILKKVRKKMWWEENKILILYSRKVALWNIEPSASASYVTPNGI